MLVAAAAGCPDPRGRFDEFNARILDAGAEIDAVPVPDASPLGEIPDISGTFLIGVDPVVAPGKILQFISVNTLTANGDGTATMTMDITPITVDAREPIGSNYLMTDIAVNEAGQFESVATDMPIDGTANPVSGSPLIVDITLRGTIKSVDRACGDVVGRMTSPWEANLTGSTFSMIRVPDGATGTELPPVEGKCPSP